MGYPVIAYVWDGVLHHITLTHYMNALLRRGGIHFPPFLLSFGCVAKGIIACRLLEYEVDSYLLLRLMARCCFFMAGLQLVSILWREVPPKGIPQTTTFAYQALPLPPVSLETTLLLLFPEVPINNSQFSSHVNEGPKLDEAFHSSTTWGELLLPSFKSHRFLNCVWWWHLTPNAQIAAPRKIILIFKKQRKIRWSPAASPSTEVIGSSQNSKGIDGRSRTTISALEIPTHSHKNTTLHVLVMS